MKEKIENRQKKPWYVRFSNYYDKKYKFIKRIAIILSILAYIIGSVISYGVLKSKPMTSYEEEYDVEFKNYVNKKLENVASEVVDENTGINHKKLREKVSKYNIEYVEQGEVFTYYLDTEQTISDYRSETGKEPILSYMDSEEEFGMKVELSDNFEVVFKESFLQISETREEYEQLYPRRILLGEFMLDGLLIGGAILGIYSIFMFLIPTYAYLWKKSTKSI